MSREITSQEARTKGLQLAQAAQEAYRMTQTNDRFAKLDRAFAETKVESLGPKPLPEDGTYSAVIEGFDFFEGKKEPNHLFMKTSLTIDAQGATWPAEIIHDLENPARYDFLKRHLLNMGAHIERISEIEAKVGKLVGTPVEVAVTTSDKTDGDGNPYRNVYVNKRTGAPPKQAQTEKPEPAFPGFS